MKIKSLTGFMLGAAFFAAAQLVSISEARADNDIPFLRETYNHILDQAGADPCAILSEGYSKPTAVEDVLAAETLVHRSDDPDIVRGVIGDLGTFIDHPDEGTRITALRSIALIGQDSDQELWAYALDTLKTFNTNEQNSMVRAAVMEMVGVMGGPMGPVHSQDTTPYLLSHLKGQAAPEVKAAAMRALDYGSRAFNAEKAELFRQYNNPHEADIVRAAAVHALGILGELNRSYTEEAMNASIDALRVDNPGIVVRDAAQSALGLFNRNHLNDNYAGSDEKWAAQITSRLMAVLQSNHDDDTRMTALWMWAGIAFNFRYGDALRDLHTAASVRLSDPEKQKAYDKEVAAVREALQPALPALQP